MEFVPESAFAMVLCCRNSSLFFKANTKYPLYMSLELYLKYEPSSTWCSAALLSPDLLWNNFFQRCDSIHLNDILSQSLKEVFLVTVLKPFHCYLFKSNVFNLGVNTVSMPIPYFQAVSHLLVDFKTHIVSYLCSKPEDFGLFIHSQFKKSLAQKELEIWREQ